MPSYEVSPLSSCEVTPYEDQLTDALWYRASQRAVELLNTHDLQCADLRWPTPLATLPIALPLRSRAHYDDTIDPMTPMASSISFWPSQVYLSREHTQQYQSFASMATTGVRSIVIRDRSTDWTAEEVADAIKHVRKIIPRSGRYIPLYQQSTGELLLTPEQFDAARR